MINPTSTITAYKQAGLIKSLYDTSVCESINGPFGMLHKHLTEPSFENEIDIEEATVVLKGQSKLYRKMGKE